MIIKTKISPYGAFAESLVAGQIVEGEFVQQKGWRALDDERLKVKRTYGGSVGKRSSTHYYTIEAPEDYHLAIARRYKTDLELVVAQWEYEILYTPKEIKS